MLLKIPPNLLNAGKKLIIMYKSKRESTVIQSKLINDSAKHPYKTN